MGQPSAKCCVWHLPTAQGRGEEQTHCAIHLGWYTVRTFDSIKQVRDELGYNSSQIIKVAKHKKGFYTSHGYKWEYIPKKNEKK